MLGDAGLYLVIPGNAWQYRTIPNSLSIHGIIERLDGGAPGTPSTRISRVQTLSRRRD